MKQLIYCALALATAAAACTTAQQSEKTATEADSITPAQGLISRLHAIQDSGLVAFGHHDDLAYGHDWQYVAGNSDVKAVTGDYPAIVNWDLGMLEWGADKNLDGVPFDYMRQQMAAHAARGGINSISWHPRNPITLGDSWDTSAEPVAEMVTPGTALNDTLTRWLGNVTAYIASLRDDQGNPLPVVFRPWHEHTGEWFWWGINHCTPDQFKALFAMTHAAADSAGLNNVVWAYSPDKSNCTNRAEYLERYPGDEYVDIFGGDIYHFDGEAGNETFTQRVTNVISVASELAKERGKLAALTETGSEGQEVPYWWENVLMPAIAPYDICYVTVWRNGYHMDHHFYTPYPGHPNVPDFLKYYNDPKSAFLNDIKDIK